MQFTQNQLALAGELKAAGLAWKPAAGHFLYDPTHAFKPSSPFQDHVYLILNYDCFLKAVGGEQKFLQLMTWLPTWDDARHILRSLGVPDRQVQQEIIHKRSLCHATELLDLYSLILKQLRQISVSEGPFPCHGDPDRNGRVV
ncbi:MAG: hypothetical protein GTO53_10200 [Planctomycetales bacterium]|nr:hypothetical protein [Planctomycetales bacterium]NIM09492.1 hypothetical protein [Planctomycetales bacterium]NIN08980.1 hypothetical protein [Planctomycetales bacterium]NIN78095.1 hypothetical protein [Planctomycetales bacterium]NIO35274.1 hypothetical protein [Planctomycetales bacterium]